MTNGNKGMNVIKNMLGSEKFARRFEGRSKKFRAFKCSHCGQELGEVDMEHDEYELMRSHIWSCPSKDAAAFRKAKAEEEYRGEGYD